MDITIKRFTKEDLNYSFTIDDQFKVDSLLLLMATEHSIQYSVRKVLPYEKMYSEGQGDLLDLQKYLNHPDQAIFLAIDLDDIVGMVIVRRNWNEFAYVEDIKVDQKYRRHGIGRLLMDKVKKWSQDNDLAGIMLETQNNNINACKFYERYGFIIGGFDKFVYKGINHLTEEVAIYWYLIFE
ncbi:GNAT family N-acetyltransferase [Bacillus paramycoides]|uniref:GNAT family N-acetyltransferase n=1 Tax=Bacillus paramycoides TaxID=2026194 RepID=UPI003D1BD82E